MVAFGALVLALPDSGVPDRSALTEVTGRLRSLEKTTSKGGGLGSVRFSLSTDARHFSYHSSAGRIDEVWDALNRAGDAEVEILIDPADSHAPSFDDRAHYAVLAVSVGKQPIRSYPAVSESLRANNFIGAALGHGAAPLGAILLVAAFLKRRRHA